MFKVRSTLVAILPLFLINVTNKISFVWIIHWMRFVVLMDILIPVRIIDQESARLVFLHKKYRRYYLKQ